MSKLLNWGFDQLQQYGGTPDDHSGFGGGMDEGAGEPSFEQPQLGGSAESPDPAAQSAQLGGSFDIAAQAEKFNQLTKQICDETDPSKIEELIKQAKEIIENTQDPAFKEAFTKALEGAESVVQAKAGASSTPKPGAGGGEQG